MVGKSINEVRLMEKKRKRILFLKQRKEQQNHLFYGNTRPANFSIISSGQKGTLIKSLDDHTNEQNWNVLKKQVSGVKANDGKTQYRHYQDIIAPKIPSQRPVGRPPKKTAPTTPLIERNIPPLLDISEVAVLKTPSSVDTEPYKYRTP